MRSLNVRLRRKSEWVEVTRTITSKEVLPYVEILTSKPKGSNSMETLLSGVKRHTEIKFLTSLAAKRIYLI
ncbi:hypothetical protein HanIR_Chr04g0163051 [Helianthus annuus]|nr:hypothetical protein HanIR_Chr04g0163051 [Helianthus annuus]